MSERPEALRKMLEELAVRERMPAGAAADIETAILTSSDLRARMVKAAEKAAPALEHINVAAPGSHSGGYFDGPSNTLHVAAEIFDERISETRIDNLAGVMGHEISHALLETSRDAANETFRVAVRNAVAKGDDLASVDLTGLTKDYLAFARHDESVSEIGGFNAISSRVTDGNHGKVDVGQILKRAAASTSFVTEEPDGSFKLAEGITHGADGKVSAAKITVDGKLVENPNIEAVAKVHFDQSRRSLGQGGATDYRNYYGAAALEIIADEVQTYRQQNQGIAPDPKLDFAKLGLDATQMQASGLNLSLGKEHGKDVLGFTFLDSSHGGLEQRVFHHSRTPGRSTAQPDNDPAAERAVSASPADFGHPDHATLEQIRAGVRAASGQIGAHDDASVERLSRSLLAATKDQRDAYPHTRNEPLAGRELSRVDQVVVGGGNLFAVEGRSDDPAMKRAFVNIEHAMQTPVVQSDQKLEAANQQITQEQAVTRQQELVQSQQQETQRVPSLTR